MQQVTQTRLVVALLDRGVGVDGDAQRARGEALLAGADARGGVGEAGGPVGGRQAEAGMAHDGRSLAWRAAMPRPGRYDGPVSDTDSDLGRGAGAPAGDAG